MKICGMSDNTLIHILIHQRQKLMGTHRKCYC